MPGEVGTVVADVRASDRGGVVAYGWTPWQFIRRGLLQFLFTDDDDRRTQVGFVEQQVRLQLARHAYPLEGSSDGAVVIVNKAADTVPFDFERGVSGDREARPMTDGFLVQDFGDLVSLIEQRLVLDDEPEW